MEKFLTENQKISVHNKGMTKNRKINVQFMKNDKTPKKERTKK